MKTYPLEDLRKRMSQIVVASYLFNWHSLAQNYASAL